MAPQFGRVFLDQVGAQQISAFARASLPQLGAIEAIAERGAVRGEGTAAWCRLRPYQGGAVAPPAAIANAVRDALSVIGAEVNETPITPRRITAAIARVRDGMMKR
jgi:cysteine synthase